jgi:flagellar hook-basal body complex protein FliE
MNNTISPDTLLAQMRAMAAQAQGKSADSGSAAAPGQSEFSELLKQSVDKVNETQADSKRLQEAFQSGDPNVQVSEVMVAMQKSNVSFQAMLQVRNKLVSAYQEIMNMQV